MTSSLSTPAAVDLRVQPVDEVLDRVERALQVRLDQGTVVRKRRTVGARTDRGTWVRIERRRLDKIDGQGWNGTECAALLSGVAKPAWYGGVVWRDWVDEVMWRADETDVLPGEPVSAQAALALPDEWWEALNTSMDVLAAQDTTRIATPDTVTITQAGVTEAIQAAFPGVSDTTITQWAPAHGDLNWANVTAPNFCLFDWEDWGMAPRGLDSAALWSNSLAVPELADRVRHERHRDLDSRDGMLMALFYCTNIIGPHAYAEDPRRGLARRESACIVAVLQAS
ncbi:hypothetical protein ACWDDN_36950 [Streptomyces griseoruber]